MFTVNPTRIYIKETALNRAGGVSALAVAATVDTERTGHLRGYVALKIETPSLVEGRTALEAARAVQATLSRESTAGELDAIKYETIPFISPACSGCRCGSSHSEDADSHTAVACRPPSAEFSPNDPMFGIQWGLQRTNVPRAWEIVRGSSARHRRRDRRGRPARPSGSRTFTRSPGTHRPTHPMAARRATTVRRAPASSARRLDNGQGVAGAAGGVRIMAIATATWADVDIAEGLYFAADNGARVVSMSFGVYAVVECVGFRAHPGRAPVCVRQGASCSSPRPGTRTARRRASPAAMPGRSASAAATEAMSASGLATRRARTGGAPATAPTWMSWRPVSRCPTTDRLGGAGYAAGDYFDRFNGTSSATPLVAGHRGAAPQRAPIADQRGGTPTRSRAPATRSRRRCMRMRTSVPSRAVPGTTKSGTAASMRSAPFSHRARSEARKTTRVRAAAESAWARRRKRAARPPRLHGFPTIAA